MSLLLDALKRAEEANKAKEGGAAIEDAAVFPVTPASSDEVVDRESTMFSTASPGLSLVEEPALSQLAAQDRTGNAGVIPDLSDSSPIAPTNAETIAKRETVRNVFAVKQQTQLSPADRRKPALIIVLSVVTVAVIGGGGWYMWRELSKLSRPTMTRLAPSAVQAPPPPSVASSADSRSATNEPLPPLLPPPRPVAPAIAKTGPLPSTDREALAALALQTPPPGASSLRWQRVDQSEATAGVAPTVAAAYAALRAGQWATAKRLYTQALAAQPGNVDAYLGLATIAMRQGEHYQARRHYGRVLEIDPVNALAAGALAVLDGRNAGGEADLRAVIARSPDVAALHFVLGNKLAADHRWVDAQEAYFEAARLDPANADFAFNLAISLDQLGQTRAAASQYRRALSLPGGQFDVGAAERRLRMLAEKMATELP